MNRMKEIVDSARQLGLSLPDAFLQVMASPDLQDRIPSCTACYFDLPEKIVPCPGSGEGYLIRFLNDQQAVLMWYLYIPRVACMASPPSWLSPAFDDAGRIEHIGAH